jgi:hypothetical protein
MTDPDRLPGPWTYAVVAVWGVGGFVIHLVRGVAVWLAALVSGGLVVLALLAMVVAWSLSRRTRAGRPPAVDLDNASASQLFDFAVDVSRRIRRWTGPGLDSSAREHAERARESIDGIVRLLKDVYADDELAEKVLPRMRASMKLVGNVAAEEPVGAGGWYDVKDWLAGEHMSMRRAVEAADEENNR